MTICPGLKGSLSSCSARFVPCIFRFSRDLSPRPCPERVGGQATSSHSLPLLAARDLLSAPPSPPHTPSQALLSPSDSCFDEASPKACRHQSLLPVGLGRRASFNWIQARPLPGTPHLGSPRLHLAHREQTDIFTAWQPLRSMTVASETGYSLCSARR
ncbi:unnamed protein product [Protopolystoma xenopodis]|uniref:Uncharacterized protein n=1 Tax=Protopolystoma xenopodis TaxID=117903 RepID=A0A448WMI8_9PLAT|nr:unnamed protein product [Protopolystoma xenopodis]